MLDDIRLTQQAAANVQHHGRMTPQQQLERRLIALVDVAAQQLGVGHAAIGCRAENSAQIVQDRMLSCIAHQMLAAATFLS